MLPLSSVGVSGGAGRLTGTCREVRSAPARGTVTRSGRNPLAGVRGAVRRVGPGPGTAGTRYTDHDTKGPDLDRIRGLLCYLDARANTARTTKPPPSRDVIPDLVDRNLSLEGGSAALIEGTLGPPATGSGHRDVV